MRRVFFCALIAICAADLVVALDALQPSPAGIITGDIVVGNSPGFIAEWLQTSPEHSPVLPVERSFVQGDTAYLAFISTGALPNEKGTGNITVDVRIAKPDGSELFFKQSYAHYTRPLSTRPSFVMCDPALDLTFDTSDSPGLYTVTAIFHDLVAHKAAIVEIKLELVPKKKA
jgi:hypothetical protein